MIASVETLSLAQARKAWDTTNAGLLEALARMGMEMRDAWIGFDTCVGDRSPLHDARFGHRLVVRCVDWDTDGKDAPAIHGPAMPELAPSIEHARSIVRFVLKLHAERKTYFLRVHCQHGLFRSGAVAEWVRSDLGVVEYPCSNRLENVIGETAEQRPFNIALLRMLREAHAEIVRQTPPDWTHQRGEIDTSIEKHQHEQAMLADTATDALAALHGFGDVLAAVALVQQAMPVLRWERKSGIWSDAKLDTWSLQATAGHWIVYDGEYTKVASGNEATDEGSRRAAESALRARRVLFRVEGE